MNKGLALVLGLAAGAVGGAFVSNKILKQQYEQKTDEGIAACQQAFLKELAKIREELNAKKAEEMKKEAEKAIKEYSPEEKQPENPVTSDNLAKKWVTPYQIDEIIYNATDNRHVKRELKYFPSDGVVVRDDNSIIGQEDLDYAIGLSSLSLFDDDESDLIYIRNDRLGVDYEVEMLGIRFSDWKAEHFGK